MMRSINALIIFLILWIPSSSQHQVKLKGGAVVDIDAITSATQQTYTETYPQGELRYDGVVRPGEKFRIEPSFHSQFTGGSEEGSYSRHKVKPYVIDGSVTSWFLSEHHTALVLLEANLTPSAKAIAFPVIPSEKSDYVTDSLRHRNSSGVGTAYGLEFEHFRGDADILYHQGIFDRFSPETTELYRESDLYYHGDIAALFQEGQIFLGASLFRKNDLNEYDGYNWIHSSVNTGTKLVLNRRKTMIFSYLALTNLQGDMIRTNEYTTGIGKAARIRLVQQLRRGLWLKADMDMLRRTDMLKSRFGGSIRKSWRWGALEGGYWTTVNSLFPRQCGWINGSVRLIKNHLELEPTCKNYWIAKDMNYHYYRTDVALSFNALPRENSRKLVFTGGGLWKNFNDASWYSSGVELFLGLETLL